MILFFRPFIWPDFHKNVRDFACNFDMEIMEVKGNEEIAEKSYGAAKKVLSSILWNDFSINYRLKYTCSYAISSVVVQKIWLYCKRSVNFHS
ncbi:MAG: hypothetical protein ACPK85_06810 [Methanosarcina sp.]